jgi:putative flavoprotein involved in K+ transport
MSSKLGEVYDAIVIGAGQAGLATGYHLGKAGLHFVILEAQQGPRGSWAHYYDSLTLFSPARYSSLPGAPFPGDPDHYPTRDEVVAYLEDYAERFELPVVGHARVNRVERSRGVYGVRTTRKGSFHARALVAASGSFYSPNLPRLPGQERCQGTVIHAADYKNPRPFRGRRVIVVGAGNSAVQIAVELAEQATVTLATRGRVRFIPQKTLGCDFHCWVKWTGLDYLPWLKDRSAPVLDAGAYEEALRSGRPKQRPVFESFFRDGVVWPDGRREPVDAVIFATGYRPSFPYLSGLGALDDEQQPLQDEGVSTSVPGLYFVGLSGQTSFRSATLRGVGRDAAHVVRTLRRDLR